MSTVEIATEYRDVAEDPGYRVGDDGSFWSAWTAGKFGKRGIGPTWRRLKDLGAKYGVDLGTIHKVVTRRSWKHVE